MKHHAEKLWNQHKNLHGSALKAYVHGNEPDIFIQYMCNKKITTHNQHNYHEEYKKDIT